jgi:16S rRNA (cytidine1402-2'-O)-methyltransferase
VKTRRPEARAERGRIVLAATPLGNVGDASSRLVEALGSADVVAAEDTRRLKRLAAELGVDLVGRVVSFYDAVERERAGDLADAAENGQTVVVVSDAGMPSVSDPGYRLVALAVERGIDVTVLPGPSAVLAALAVSGLPVDRFCFEGFLPRKAGERSARLAELAAEPRTMVFFEAPHRLDAMLTALAEELGGERRAAVCRELTKTYEEVRRGTLDELAAWAADGVRGEITVVVSGASQEQRRSAAGLDSEAGWLAAVAAQEATGADRRSAIADVAKRAGVPRREVYDAVVRAKPRGADGGASRK